MRTRRCVLLLACLAAILSAAETPLARGRLPRPETVVLPAPEAQRLPGSVGPTRPLPEDIAGTWDWTPEGRRVWRARLEAPGARALRVRFESFHVPGRVWLYGDAGERPAVGPYGGSGPHRDGGFWSAFVFAEAVTVEYLPDEATPFLGRVPFRLSSVAQILDERFPVPRSRAKAPDPRPRSIAGCHLDASCFPALEKRSHPSVALLYISTDEGTGTCTGFLINTRHESPSRILMLTAGHCVDTPEKAADLSLLWKYQTEECYGNPDWEAWDEPYAFSYGASLAVSRDDDSSDFSLLVLSRADVLGKTGVTRLGWTLTEPRVGDQVSTIGHPDAGFKRVAFGQVVSYSWKGASPSGFNTVQWRLGSSEGGSSGSPVLAGSGEDRRVVGIISGGNDSSLDQESPWGPYCDPDLRTVISRFDQIYETIEPYLESEGAGELPAPPPRQARVALGTSGDSVTLVQGDDDLWRVGGALAVSGETAIRAENGNVYTLVLEADGRDGAVWTAVYVPEAVRVRLGTSGYVIMLEKAEDGTWQYGTRGVNVGSIIHGPVGKRYRLAVLNGRWVAVEVED